MTSRGIFTTLALLVSACGPSAFDKTAPAAKTAQQSPAAVVEALYAPYLAQDGANASPNVEIPWTDETQALVTKEDAKADGEVGAVDYDPIIDAQDWKLSGLEITQETPPTNGRATILAHFQNLDHDTHVHYDMVQQNGAWRVDNIRSDKSNYRDLVLAFLATPAGNSAPPAP